MSDTVLPGSIDLSQAKEISFDAFAAGTYDATVFSVKPVAVKNVNSNSKNPLPVGTPGINVQFRIDDGQEAMSVVDEDAEEPMDIGNRRVFKAFYIAPEDHPSKKSMDGMLFGFLKICLGEKDARKKNLNIGELVADGTLEGAPCRVRVTVGNNPRTGERNNGVASVLPPREGDDGAEEDEF